MAKKLPAGDSFRSTGRLNVWFALVSLLLFACTVWMVLDDYSRDWKGWQRTFRNVELDKVRSDLQEAQAELDQRELERLEQSYAEAEQSLQQRRDELEEIDEQLAEKKRELYKVDLRYKEDKSYLDAAKYEVVAAREKDEGVAEAEQALAEARAVEAESLERLKQVRSEIARLEEQQEELRAAVEAVQAEMNAVTKQVSRLSDRAEQLEPKLAQRYLLDQPIVDFMAPSLKVRQVVLDHLKMDFSFSQVPRVDRCQTCHLAIDKPGFENYDNPMKTHPRLDLYLAGDSPHPMNNYGCTVCHEGRDRGTSFNTAAHTPSDDEEAAEWEEKYGWEPIHHWNMPMYPSEHTEAGCYRCHDQRAQVPEAETLNWGMALMEQSGCYGCHTIERYEGFRKAGPDLSKIASKVKRDWMLKWIEEPRAFRPDTRMPRFYGLLNNDAPDDVARNHVEIEALTEYLLTNSEERSFARVYPGDASRGEELFDTVGCRACHAVEPGDYPRVTRLGRGMFGPTLSGIGSKTTPEFLYQWIRDPQSWWPETRMPSLRLTEREARDVVAYLMTLRNPEFERRPVPRAADAVLDEAVREHYRLKKTAEQIDELLASMSRRDKLLFVGEKTIQRSGCFGCHNIRGFEDSQPIGTPLDGEGNKLLHKFDFALQHQVPHTRHDWITTKLLTPRIFDEGMVKEREEKLRMPRFYFTAEEARAVTTVVVGMVKHQIPHEWRDTLDDEQAVIEHGRWLVRHNNCRGCHLVEGKGGEVLPVIEQNLLAEGLSADEASTRAAAFGPPNLYAEGSKVKPDWFFNFLRAPTTIRPWLEMRMPTFGFDHPTANDLVHYFSAVDREDFPYGFHRTYPMTASERSAAERLLSAEIFNCWNCHVQGGRTPSGPPSGWAPDLAMARERLKGQWIVDWLRDPQQLMPGTRMPSFFLDESSGPPFILDGDEQRQMEVIRDYLMNLPGRRAYTETGAPVAGSP